MSEPEDEPIDGDSQPPSEVERSFQGFALQDQDVWSRRYGEGCLEYRVGRYTVHCILYGVGCTKE